MLSIKQNRKALSLFSGAGGMDIGVKEAGFRYLLKTTYGCIFVNIYYQLSPYIANKISKSESLKAITRYALYPIIYIIR